MANILTQSKKSAVFCFLLFFLGMNVFAQTSRIDDLLDQLKKNNTDTAQIRIMRKLSSAYSSVDPIKKFYYANQYRLLADKNGIDSLVASAYLDMGISYGIRSKMDSALYYFNLGFQKAKESNYLNGIARSHANIGFAYDRLDRKKEAVKNYEESLKLYKKLNNKMAINQSITNLGSIYFDLGEYKTADGYFKQVLENVKETPADQMGMANALFSLGNSNRKLDDPKKALDYYQKSLAIREKLGDLNGIALSNWGIGQLYINSKAYTKAMPHLQIALKNNRALKNLYHECVVLLSLGHAQLGLKAYKDAQATAKLALLRAKESNSKGLTAEALELLVEINTEQKNFADALRFQTDYMAVNDSLNLNKTKKEVIINDLHRINTDNKNLQKDNKSIIAKNSNYITAIAIVTVLLVVVGLGLVLYYRRNAEKKATNVLLQKQKQEIAEANEELGALNEELTAQMDIISAQNIELEKLNKVKNKFFSIVSHDLRGPLITLKSLFELYRKGHLTATELNELLGKLEDTIYTTATFLDNLLEWSRNQLDGMTIQAADIQLLPIVNDNIKLMDHQRQLKFLNIENYITDNIRVFADHNMIDTVVRNLLSNAIKFCNVGDKIIFDAQVTADHVVFAIRDTGPGMSDTDKANLFNLAHTASTGTAGEKGYHIGLILCRDMVVQNNGTITLDSKLGEGTTFYITLPNQPLA